MKIVEAIFKLCLTDGNHPLTVHGDTLSLVGISHQDFLAKKVGLISLFHADDSDIADEIFNCSTCSKQIVNFRLRHINGSIQCVRGEYTKTLDDKHLVILEIRVQDARSLWRSADAVPMSANFAAMMENTDDYIYFKDRNHVFTGASQTLVSVTNPSKHWSDLLGKTDYDVFPENLADIYYRLEKLVFRGLPVAHEVQQTQDNAGRFGWVDNRKYPIKDEQGEIVGLFGIARDITDQKRLLDEQNAILQTKLVGMAIVRGRHVVWANQTLERLLGYASGELVGMPTRCFYANQADYESIGDSYSQILTSDVLRSDFEFVTKSGARLWLDMSGTLLHQDTGESLWVFVDVTVRKQAEGKLRIAANAFEAKVGIMVTDANCNILKVNETFTKITGYANAEAVGKHPNILKSFCHDSSFYQQMWDSIRRYDYWEGEIYNRRKNGETYPERLNVTVTKDVHGNVTNYVATFVDISEQKRLLAELEFQAKKDSLTGLANRRHFFELAESELGRAKRYKTPLSIMMMDIDHFKNINDHFGHKAGDSVLKKLSAVCTALLREVDTMGRIGGEEFAVLLPETEISSAREVAERIRCVIADTPFILDDQSQITVTVSIGVAAFDGQSVSVDNLLQLADQELYKAKRLGRNRVIASQD